MTPVQSPEPAEVGEMVDLLGNLDRIASDLLNLSSERAITIGVVEGLCQALDSAAAGIQMARTAINIAHRRALTHRPDMDLEARLSSMREALEPFVKWSEGETDTLIVRTNHKAFRRAREAFRTSAQPDETIANTTV